AVGLDAAPEAAVVLRREAEQRVLVRGEDDRRVRRPFREDLRTACDPDVGVGRGKHERVTRFDRQSRPLTLLRNALARCGIDRIYVLSDIEAVLEDVESAETPERDRADSDRTRRADERRVVVAVTVRSKLPLVGLAGLLVASAGILPGGGASSAGRVIDGRRLEVDVSTLATDGQDRDAAERRQLPHAHHHASP